jgi:hypothetical protein
MDVLMASPTDPLPQFKRTHQLTLMFEALRSLEQSPSPTNKDWETVNNAVLLMEALKDMGVVQDPEGLLDDAIEALGEAGFKAMEGSKLRLTGPAIQTLRGVLKDYSDVLDVLPARTMLTAHRKAERRVMKIVRKK